MRRLTAFAAALAFAGCAPALAGSIGATQAWVARFVTNYVDSASVATRPVEGGTAYSAGGATIVLEEPTVPALIVRDPCPPALAAGLRDGDPFAWSEADGVWRRGALQVETSATNALLVAGGTAYSWSRRRPGLWLCDARTNWFCRLASTSITPSRARLAWEGRR